jgi:hypothetical protein
MRVSRIGMAVAALAAGAAMAIGSTGVASAAPGTAAAAAPAASAVNTPVTGTFSDLLGGTGTFTGTFTPTQFEKLRGRLAATGTLTGTLTDSAGTLLGNVTKQVTVPVHITNPAQGSNAAQLAAACDILNLDLGPLDLNLLGLQVHLNEVVLNITAQSGPGNLLGNLLCAVAGLLDQPGNGVLNQIADLLNQILSLLG